MLMRWSNAKKRLHVKVRPLKLEAEGLCLGIGGAERMVVLKMKWKGPRSSGLVPFRTRRRNYYSSSKYLFMEKGFVEWDQEEYFESVCDFWVSTKNDDFFIAPWDVTFQVLGGEDGDSGTKMKVWGGVSLNVAELAFNSLVEKRLPISLQIEGVATEATLLVRVSFAEVRTCHDDHLERSGQNLAEGNGIKSEIDACRCKHYSSEPSVLNSDGSLEGTGPNIPEDIGSNKEVLVTKVGLISPWKRLLTLRSFKRKREQLVNGAKINPLFAKDSESCVTSRWEVKEIASRDGKAKLKTNTFFASFDQRSERVAGESACTALVVVIAHWLHSNRQFMPTRLQFDSLITEGSLEWRRLCNHKALTNSFPDNHFDIETVLEADLRPLTILPHKSYTGIFSPEKFKNYKEAMSFDNIWKEISSNEDYDERIYIVSWNDHFFILKLEADTCYLIDTLGERLFEGCNQAYILKFDNSSLLYEKMAKEEASSEGITRQQRNEDEEAIEEIVCRGKDCCREFIKRFFAAIPVSELEEEEKKGTLFTFSPLQRLQIDFHYCSYSSASSSSTSLSSSVTSVSLSNDSF